MPKKRKVGYARTIDGKRYLKLTTVQGKDRAKQKATAYRKKGYSIRIFKTAYPLGYTLWGRKR